MKVWIVLENLDYEGQAIVAIYSSKESAEAHRDRAIAEKKSGLRWPFFVEEHSVLE